MDLYPIHIARTIIFFDALVRHLDFLLTIIFYPCFILSTYFLFYQSRISLGIIAPPGQVIALLFGLGVGPLRPSQSCSSIVGPIILG
jgi:hypothetical protein